MVCFPNYPTVGVRVLGSNDAFFVVGDAEIPRNDQVVDLVAELGWEFADAHLG